MIRRRQEPVVYIFSLDCPDLIVTLLVCLNYGSTCQLQFGTEGVYRIARLWVSALVHVLFLGVFVVECSTETSSYVLCMLYVWIFMGTFHKVNWASIMIRVGWLYAVFIIDFVVRWSTVINWNGIDYWYGRKTMHCWRVQQELEKLCVFYVLHWLTGQVWVLSVLVNL